jgi:hypothetical protein
MISPAKYLYTGIGEGAVVPKDVARVRIGPSVLVIPEHAFSVGSKMETIELHDGLCEIGRQAFCDCRALREVQSPDRVDTIGSHAFAWCNFTKFRSPPLVTTIPHGMLSGCTGLFSLELPEIIIQVEGNAFGHCHSLRSLALVSNTVVAENAFFSCTDLLHIFGSEEVIVNALRNRFDGLPVHCKMYYTSYYPKSLEEFRNIFMSENGELDPTGLHQDCLGMTPLHVLACSTVQCLEVYQLIVDMYPNNLIVEDAWGATPLLYAIWGDAPSEIVELLVNSYQSLYPNHDFNWNDMLLTLGRTNAAEGVMQNLLDIQQTLSPGYIIMWEQILGEFAIRPARPLDTSFASSATFCFLIRCSIAKRVKAICVKHFRDAMVDDWTGNELNFNRQVWLAETVTKLEYYESEYQRLKEMTSLLELTLWKIEIDNNNDQGETMGGGNEKMEIDQSDFRLQCRVSCGADHVVENVWPYLLPSAFVRAYVYSSDEEDDDNADSDDNTGEEDNDDDDVDDDDNVEEVDEIVEEDEWLG